MTQSVSRTLGSKRGKRENNRSPLCSQHSAHRVRGHSTEGGRTPAPCHRPRPAFGAADLPYSDLQFVVSGALPNQSMFVNILYEIPAQLSSSLFRDSPKIFPSQRAKRVEGSLTALKISSKECACDRTCARTCPRNMLTFVKVF